MTTYILAVISAFWLGILTSVSPCPLATNIAAVSYISRKLNKRNVIISGIFYTIGRMAAYILVSAIIVFSIVSTPALSMFLQQHTPKIIGPLLIITGMFLLELITISIPGTKNIVNAQKYGLFAEVVIGFVFALSFCPVSAALFLGSLIPLAVSQNSAFVLPLVYGIGTAIPVLVFAILFTISAEKMGQWFNKVTAAELRIRQAFGIILILIGVFFTLRYIFGIV